MYDPTARGRAQNPAERVWVARRDYLKRVTGLGYGVPRELKGVPRHFLSAPQNLRSKSAEGLWYFLT